ncbi:hypothetical protein KKF34_10115 [Myxococcota bacterium]|nr:hypothetical protein [Myxococcota bacterium]MBU1379622.1 hypothetical protein [Myxococcota bacterium]MBU1497221.1 hypothetical protein [Myxococcota bacterium]
MNTPIFENLDLSCAAWGKDIADDSPSKELENSINKAISVLEEQGIYAMFLFLKTKGGRDGEKIKKSIFEFLKQTPKQSPLLSRNGDDDVFKSLQQICNDLDKLLLARDLVRQTLVYALYHSRLQKNEVRS